MTNQQTIALDAMGGDFGPDVVVPAAGLALRERGAGLRFIFFGDEARIGPLLAADPALNAVSSIHHTDKMIANDEKPSAALRSGKESSMRLAIDAVKAGDADSVVSAGNTGALMATAKLVLKCLPGINRPAIASVFPTTHGDTVMLDLGANLTCDAAILSQFAVLGAVYAKTVAGVEKPTVGLLNIGSEDVKGPDQLREAAAILSTVEFPGEFYGFVEGNDITKGTVNVVVTDGFTGNVALKVAEGVGQMTGHFLKEAFMSSLFAKLGAALASGALKRLKKRVDPRFYNGGMFLGLDGICVKSHGGMDTYGFSRAILVAADLVEQGYNKKVAHEIAQLMAQESQLAHENGKTEETAPS
ncbi:MAG: phosphate acyltransferase PlsX [Rhodospirillales bacterium]|nr:phosphate acyltransferase PlsX [Rhodospirillales bacterium]MCB9995516.1 phosphate acyltransferase PlsX [Rhodospirillales bacterium]